MSDDSVRVRPLPDFLLPLKQVGTHSHRPKAKDNRKDNRNDNRKAKRKAKPRAKAKPKGKLKGKQEVKRQRRRKASARPQRGDVYGDMRGDAKEDVIMQGVEENRECADGETILVDGVLSREEKYDTPVERSDIAESSVGKNALYAFVDDTHAYSATTYLPVLQRSSVRTTSLAERLRLIDDTLASASEFGCGEIEQDDDDGEEHLGVFGVAASRGVESHIDEPAVMERQKPGRDLNARSNANATRVVSMDKAAGAVADVPPFLDLDGSRTVGNDEKNDEKNASVILQPGIIDELEAFLGGSSRTMAAEQYEVFGDVSPIPARRLVPSVDEHVPTGGGSSRNIKSEDKLEDKLQQHWDRLFGTMPSTPSVPSLSVPRSPVTSMGDKDPNEVCNKVCNNAEDGTDASKASTSGTNEADDARDKQRESPPPLTPLETQRPCSPPLDVSLGTDVSSSGSSDIAWNDRLVLGDSPCECRKQSASALRHLDHSGMDFDLSVELEPRKSQRRDVVVTIVSAAPITTRVTENAGKCFAKRRANRNSHVCQDSDEEWLP